MKGERSPVLLMSKPIVTSVSRKLTSRPPFEPRNCSPHLRWRKKRRGQTPECSPRKAACKLHKNGSRSAPFGRRLLELFCEFTRELGNPSAQSLLAPYSVSQILPLGV